MQYISTKEAADNWGISQRRVIKLCGEGRIEGAKVFGISWMIPENAKKPADGRTKAVRKSTPIEETFRFPIYVNYREEDFLPPLTDEERELRAGQVEFYACRFDEAEKILAPLCERTQNRYIRISALFHLCYLAAYQSGRANYDRYIKDFNRAFDEDFPHREDMLLLKYKMDKDFGCFTSLLEGMSATDAGDYHPSSYDTFAFLSIILLVRGEVSLLSKLDFGIYEMYCLRMEEAGHFSEAQQLHYILIEMYQMQSNADRMEYHLRKGLEIAMKRKLYYRSALYEYYYPDITDKVLGEFPVEFANTIRSLGKSLRDKYVRFEQNQQKMSYWSLLSEKDFVYITYAMQGYSNKEVAHLLKTSEKVISKKYNEIYDKLDVENKHGLVELIKNTQRGKL